MFHNKIVATRLRCTWCAWRRP